MANEARSNDSVTVDSHKLTIDWTSEIINYGIVNISINR